MDTPHTPSVLDLEEDYFSKNIFADMAKWGRLLSIICLVGIGLYALILLVAGSFLSSAMGSLGGQMGDRFGMAAEIMRFGGAVFFVIIILVLGVVGLLFWFLYRGTTRIRGGIAHDDQGLFNSGLHYLKNFFVMWSVFSGISLLFTIYGMLS